MTCLITILYSAFADCKGITTLTLPEGITSIGDHAFTCEYFQWVGGWNGWRVRARVDDGWRLNGWVG